MMKMSKSVVLLFCVMLLTFVAACGSTPASNQAAAPNNAPANTPEANAATDTNAEPEAEPAVEQEIVMVKFSEVIRSIFYAPHYVAMQQGFFEEEGLEIDMNTAQGSDKGAAALIAGTADISLVGPETAIYIYNQEGDKKIKIFHQLTMKDGSFLLSREKLDAFEWSDLAGKTIVGWRPGSAPQMVMNSQLLKENVTDVEVITNLAAPAMAGAFTSGQGDFIQLFEPVASTLVKEGVAHYAASMGEAFGTFPETSYVATSDFIGENPEVIQKFVNAVAKGAEWISSATDDEIADALMPFFEGTPKDIIIQSVERYKNQDTWPAVPELTAEGFETLQSVLIENGVLKAEEKIANMEDVVDMSFVNNLK
ncbi:ABC transporter substrate-binding protein [Paenibacillus abyssi]|uniref:ABC transporter substrate-binding protein n=1 Tax=Paenibacillus abyssi TaxID=1340531 RepID=A0A917FMU1_9BACL|nr:ABC transporter substrate-binding protein [Paenibacillus abyssi]GGF94548.1 ABC transporter substrate-binding protein [Paenibacillus abyssi]